MKDVSRQARERLIFSSSTKKATPTSIRETLDVIAATITERKKSAAMAEPTQDAEGAMAENT